MRRFVVAVVACTLAGAMLCGPASAHGDRAVEGAVWTVGWADEPALVGFKNAVQLFLARQGSDEPVEGAQEDLTVEVSIGGEQTEPLELRTVFESPGEYRADLIPTVPGDYTFRFTGTLDGRAVDQSFTASKDDFSLVQGTADVAFPKAAPTNAELAERLEAAEASARDASGEATLPLVLGGIALVVALAALVVARKGGVSA